MIIILKNHLPHLLRLILVNFSKINVFVVILKPYQYYFIILLQAIYLFFNLFHNTPNFPLKVINCYYFLIEQNYFI